MIVGMRRLAVALTLLLTVVATSARAQAPRAVEPEQSRPWAVYFSPGGGAAQAVVEAVGRAGHSVLVQAAALTSPQITKALVFFDCEVDGIDRAHPANSNVMVIDAEVVVTGSSGFTVAADRETADSLLVIHSPTLAARYGENWQVHAAHSVRHATSSP